ncbi:hypothetical protein L7F22_030624 [Adiantum nelumboides]|nr:hypothetical protein [Adiantum nelumboides]
MDPSPSSTPIISDCLREASFTDVAVADALYLQVLQAFSDEDFDSLLLVFETIDEISLDEALSGPKAFSWRQAMDSEYQSLMANGTWQLVPAPPNQKLVTCKWLLRKIFHADGSVSRYKARLVACGFTQIPGMDYSETFSPVLCITSFRVLIAIAALFGFLLHQMDVRTAFLNGDLQEEIYMSQPDGGYTSLQHPDYVCRLLKALYGLKQSPKQWAVPLSGGRRTASDGLPQQGVQFEFECRKNVALSIDTDKADEDTLHRAVEAAPRVHLRGTGVTLVEYTSYVDLSTIPAHYVLFWELEYHTSSHVDQSLILKTMVEECCWSIEEKLDSVYRQGHVSDGSIGLLEIRVVQRESFEALMDYCLSRGVSINQYKDPRCVKSAPIVQLMNCRVQSFYFSPRRPTWRAVTNAIQGVI